EAVAQEFVRTHTSIPVPRIRRCIADGHGHGYMVMERIEGVKLDRLWPSLNTWQRFIVVWTIRGYIRQLRHVSSDYVCRDVPGPMAETPQLCNRPNLMTRDKPFGPFDSAPEFYQYWNDQYKDKVRARNFCLDDTVPLVLTHNDLRPGNIIVGRDGKIWLIDWDQAGFYPPWQEYLGM
ncbi:kinase-like protein, partial [Heliocybe sulcata]